jgi:hypothetical protein
MAAAPVNSHSQAQSEASPRPGYAVTASKADGTQGTANGVDVLDNPHFKDLQRYASFKTETCASVATLYFDCSDNGN